MTSELIPYGGVDDENIFCPFDSEQNYDVQVPLSDLHIDEEMTPRNKAKQWRTVARYTEAMANGDKFPPILVGQRDGGYVVIDGVHRTEALAEAADRMGETQPVALAVVTDRDPDDWFRIALHHNTRNGRHLSWHERIDGARRLRNEGVPLPDVADTVALGEQTLTKALKERVSTTADGQEVTRKAGVSETTVASKSSQEVEALQQQTKGRRVKDLLQELKTHFENDNFPREDDEAVTLALTIKHHIEDEVES